MKLILILFAVALLPMGATAQSQRTHCILPQNTAPDATRPLGTPDSRNPIEHIVIIMQENHSFDNYFGRLNKPKFYGAELDGVAPGMSNPGEGGSPLFAYHESSVCISDPEHGWDAIHREWDGGKMDGFVKVNGAKAMGFYDERDIPFYYDLANKFTVADRYFCSTLTQTFPNRFYLFAGTSFGHIHNDIPFPGLQFNQETIFDRLNEYGISWKYYKDGPGYLELFQPLFHANREKIVRLEEFAKDLKAGRLPQVSVIDSSFESGEDEHPKANIQVGQAFVAKRIQDLVASRFWKNSILFLTYDEGGGFFDHVAPPDACVPDAVEPRLEKNSYPGRFDRYGIRVPFVAVSPYVKHHFVAHGTYDHTSILKFIELKFNIPALSMRDANADGFDEIFDFDHPDFSTKPDFSLAQVKGNCSP